MKNSIKTYLLLAAVFSLIAGACTITGPKSGATINTIGQGFPEGMSSGLPNSACPLIYSHNGTDYQLDAEVYSGAIFKAAERPEWDNLDHLQPSNGVYKLKMANVFDETQHVDFVNLLAIDHPYGSRVYPSFEGKLFTINNPQEPRSARDYYGHNVRKELRRDNGGYWLGNPFNRDLNDPKALRDGLTLEFDRPAGSTLAALVLDVQNTAWATGALRDLLLLHGRDLPAWYDQLNNSFEARGQFMDFLIREGMLQVAVWNGMMWQPAGYIWPPGAAVSKEIVLELNLEDFQDKTLKVGLEGPPGVWMVHSAEVDFSYYNIPSFTTELPLEKAVDQNGRNLLPLLQKADNRYYEMPTTKDAAYLEFQAWPERKGMTRSYMLKSGGYYTIHTPPDGEPQPELLQQLLNERGAFTRYELEKLYKQTEAVLQQVQ